MFQSLLIHPPINQIIILEDDISAIENKEDALAKYCLANEITRTRIQADCIATAQNSLSESLNFLSTEIAPFITDSYGQNELLSKGISIFAKSKNIFKEGGAITTLISEYDRLKEIFKKKGVANYTPHYDSISLSDIIYTSRIPVSIFDSGGTDSYNEMKSLISSNSGDFSKWTLLIVDKKLKATDDGIAIARSLIEQSLMDNTPVVSVVYTSTYQERKGKNVTDFFMIEVSKNSPDKFEELSSSLSKSAYIFVFNYITKLNTKAAELAFELVRNNSENIFNLMNENGREGFSTLEGMLANFSLTQSYTFDQLLFGAGDNYFNLSVGFNKDFKNPEGLSESSTDLKNINCFEIFDYRVNDKLLPIDNGDVFKIEEQYYVLVGQTCDLSIREGDNRRKNRHAELIPAKFIKENSNNKFSSHLSPSERNVEIGFFRSENGDSGKLKLLINDLKYCDFVILDLCSFNQSGKSIINLKDDSFEKAVTEFIPQRLNYYNFLKQYVSKLIVIEPKLDDLVLNDIHSWNYELEQEKSSVAWKIKRICRIKGDFSNALYSEFINHKQRLALNLILPAATLNLVRTIRIGLPSMPIENTFQINSWESGGKEFIKR